MKTLGNLLQGKDIKGLVIEKEIITIINDSVELTILHEEPYYTIRGYDVDNLGEATYNKDYSTYSITAEAMKQEIYSILINKKII